MHIFGASEKFSDESEKEKRPSVPISDKTNFNNDAKKTSQKDEKKLFLDSIFKQKDLNSKLKEEDASDLKLKTVSMEAKKRVNVFLCESATKEGKLGCEPCRRTADPTDTSLPCCFNKAPGIENTQVGTVVFLNWLSFALPSRFLLLHILAGWVPGALRSAELCPGHGAGGEGGRHHQL